ncbi:MAG TPA: GNAT family N-acetyltransferase [Rhodocyclaceae bacterium]|nr:GNAT family N-acetyltransferase [Rhodocyclaceae bacterium]
MTYLAERVADKSEWDHFVAGSPQESVFCYTWFLDLLDEPDYELWMVRDGARPLLGAIVGVDPDGRALGRGMPFFHPQMLFSASFAGFPPHRRAKEGIDLVAALLGALERRHDRLHFRLHPSFADLRALAWFHYHEPERGQFRFQIRQDGWIDLSAHADFEAYLATIRPTRRNEFRRSEREGLRLETGTDVGALDALHRMTFERQGLARGVAEAILLPRIAAAVLDNGRGWLSLARNGHGEPVSAALFLNDRRTAYYLFGANHPEFRHLFGGTATFLDSVRRAYERGLVRIDVCGINSPNRGDFKTSFNALPLSHVDAAWSSPAATT